MVMLCMGRSDILRHCLDIYIAICNRLLSPSILPKYLKIYGNLLTSVIIDEFFVWVLNQYFLIGGLYKKFNDLHKAHKLIYIIIKLYFMVKRPVFLSILHFYILYLICENKFKLFFCLWHVVSWVLS